MEVEPLRTMFLIGGPRHGQQISIAPDAPSFVDIRSGETYWVRNYMRVTVHPLGYPDKGYRLPFLVWQGLDWTHQNTQMMAADVVSMQWFIDHGEEVAMQPAPQQTENGEKK